MSETICSDLLVGKPIRDKYGITCCPALCEENGRQYFIKNIRIPASAVQASGLLLSGAYENAEQLQEYYRTVADDLCAEVSLLKNLCHMGYLPYTSWELRALESGVGFSLKMQAPCYHGIADRQWTYPEALNMGLDLCNALSACRNKGWMYANLKPENVFINDVGEYCIGDLGFLPMASLKYISLPDKYRSRYTAPEVADVYATISSNIDVYALGLILYGIFNEGILPEGEMNPPLHADYELWRIISTACHPDPLMRYEDPSQMGQALLEYVQRFGSEDRPIGVRETQNQEQIQDDTLFLSDAENEALLAELLKMIPEEKAPANLMDEIMDDACAEPENEDEIALMLAQADDLISHQLPQPVVAPAVIDVQLPISADLLDEPTQMPLLEIMEEPPIQSTEETINDEEVSAPAADEQQPEETIAEPEQEEEEIWDAPKKRNTKKIFISLAFVGLILALLITGVALYYNIFYTQTINSLRAETTSTTITVYVETNVEDEELTVVCANSNGFSYKYSVVGGKAEIDNLSPGTTYFISVEISGFHRLDGHTEEIVTTKPIINVTNFTAVTGVWRGSVDLNFVTNNDKTGIWIVRYRADGEAEKYVSFTGTQVSITDLALGKEYTFTLESQDGSPILGTKQVTHTVR